MQQQVSYNRAIKNKYPEQVVIAIVKDDQGKYNPITLGWSMIVSHEPPMMAVAIGKKRHSLSAIRNSKEFVIAFPSEDQSDAAMLFGTRSGSDIDKLQACHIATEPANRVDSVLLTDAVANFECKLTGELETGDHVVFAGEIVCSHMNPKHLRRLYTTGPGYQMGGFPRQQP